MSDFPALNKWIRIIVIAVSGLWPHISKYLGLQSVTWLRACRLRRLEEVMVLLNTYHRSLEWLFMISSLLQHCRRYQFCFLRRSIKEEIVFIIITG
jgi:hypothetical protein